MSEAVSRKLTYLQFVCALCIIGLHTVFARHFGASALWAADVNRAFRTLFDAATSTFFFLSALLFYRSIDGKRYWQVLLSRLWSLVVPFLFWNITMLLYTVARDTLTTGTFTAIPAWDVFRLLVLEPVDSVLWFVQVLLGYIVLYPIMLWCVRRGWPALLLIGAALALNLLGLFPIPYASLLFWLPCYLMGAYLGYRQKALVFRTPMFAQRWAYLVALALLGVLFWLAYTGSAFYYVYWQFAPLCLWVLADPLAKLPRPYWWVGASFYLFCAHLLFEHYAVRLYQLALGTETAAFLLANILLPCLCAAMALALGALLRLVLPSVYRLVTGGRDKREPVSASGNQPSARR